MHQNNVSFATIGFLKILDINLKNTFVINVTKGATFRCLLMGISKNEALEKLNNSLTRDRGML